MTPIRNPRLLWFAKPSNIRLFHPLSFAGFNRRFRYDPNYNEISRKKSDGSSISKTILVDWHSGQIALSTYSLVPEPGDLKKTCAIPNCPVITALIASWVSSSENLLLGTPDTANTLRAKLPRWLHFEHRTGLSEPNFGIFIVATVSSSLSALILIVFFIAYLYVMLCRLSGRTVGIRGKFSTYYHIMTCNIEKSPLTFPLIA